MHTLMYLALHLYLQRICSNVESTPVIQRHCDDVANHCYLICGYDNGRCDNKGQKTKLGRIYESQILIAPC